MNERTILKEQEDILSEIEEWEEEEKQLSRTLNENESEDEEKVIHIDESENEAQDIFERSVF